MAKAKTKTAGAYKADEENTFFDVGLMSGVLAGKGYAETFGPVVEGELTQVGIMTLPAGNIGNPHRHLNEQWIYLIEGEVEFTVDGVTKVCGPNQLVYIPSNAIHGTKVLDKPVRFFTVKDLRAGFVGTAVAAE